jgi:hypothetical protein
MRSLCSLSHCLRDLSCFFSFSCCGSSGFAAPLPFAFAFPFSGIFTLSLDPPDGDAARDTDALVAPDATLLALTLVALLPAAETALESVPA